MHVGALRVDDQAAAETDFRVLQTTQSVYRAAQIVDGVQVIGLKVDGVCITGLRFGQTSDLLIEIAQVVVFFGSRTTAVENASRAASDSPEAARAVPKL